MTDEKLETRMIKEDVIDLESDAPPTEPDSFAPTREIATYLFVNRIEENSAKPVTMSECQQRLSMLIDSIKDLKADMQGAVSAARRRPYGLSDDSWLYVLNQVRARIEAERQAKENRPQIARQELEPFLTPELKEKLRNRLPALATEDDIAGVRSENEYPAPAVVAYSVCLKTLVQFSFSEALAAAEEKGPQKAEQDLLAKGYQDLADKLKQLDSKFEIVGSYIHCVKMHTAISDLSVPTILAIYPVVRCKDTQDVKKEFDFVDLQEGIEGRKDRRTSTAVFPEDVLRS